MTTIQGVVQKVEDGKAFITVDGVEKPIKIASSKWNVGFEPTPGATVEFDDVKGSQKNLRPVGAAVARRMDPEHGTPNVEFFESHRAPRNDRSFRNPKNFVATPRRPAPGTPMGDVGPDGMRWHDRAHAGNYTGTITVMATVLTDLLISDSPRRSEDTKSKHQSHPVRMAGDRALVPATSLKGAIRSAVEAVTNSRMAVFTATHRLGSRVPADGTQLVPARIEEIDGQLMIRLLPGATPIGATTQPITMHAAWVDMAAARGAHGKQVTASLGLWQHRRGFCMYRATAVEAEGRAWQRPMGDPGSLSSAGGPVLQVEGWVCATGKTARNKHDERIFFDTPSTRVPPIAVSETLSRQWTELLTDYRAANERAVTKGNPPHGGSWGAHVLSEQTGKLAAGMLLYARVRMEQGSPDVTGLYPVQLSRELDQVSPLDLLDPALRPAATVEQLSPADVMFGWVAKEKATQSAVRGRVAVDDAYVEAMQVEQGTRTLAVLSSPKPHQSRFYLGLERPTDQVTVPFPDGALARNEVRYDDATVDERVGASQRKLKKRLRGRAVYLRHGELNPTEWSRSVMDDQNRTVTGWVKEGATFTFDVQVRDLSPVELGALLFVLNGANDGCDLNLGFGKPLGFGSVGLRVHSHALRSTDELAAWLLESNASDGTNSSAVLSAAHDAFVTASEAAFRRPFNELPHIVAWRAARREGTLPVHYPRATEAMDPKGENFKWFTENESIQGRLPKHGLSLPDLRNDVGLPYLAGQPQGGPPRPQQGGRR